MATIKDIARIAGVNVSSVSRALNGSAEISSATRERIASIARSVGYTPDPIAKALAGKGTGQIGVIVPELQTEHFPVMLSAVDAVVAAAGRSIAVRLTGYNTVEELHACDYFASVKVDGILSLCPPDANTGVRPPESARFMTVCPDSENAGVALAVEHLTAMGHRAIGFVGDNISAASKLPAFIRAMSEKRQPYDVLYIRTGGERHEEGGYYRMKELMDADPMPSAVIASSDRVAIGAIRCLRDFGLRVPGDISVVGYGNLQGSRFLPVSLTTIAVPYKEAAEAAALRLLAGISATDVPRRDVPGPELIIRESTTLYRIDDIVPLKQRA